MRIKPIVVVTHCFIETKLQNMIKKKIVDCLQKLSKILVPHLTPPEILLWVLIFLSENHITTFF